MREASPSHLQLAGMALAHAVWSIEYGDTLCTLAMLRDEEGRNLARYEAPSIAESVEDALSDLKERLIGTAVAALVYDGYHTSEDGKRCDALIVELLAANRPGESPNTAAQLGRIVQEYVPGRRALFRRTRLKLVGRPHSFGVVPPDASDRVVEGAMEHEKVRDLFSKI